MEIAPGLYSLMEFQGGYVHAFIVDDGAGLTVVDTLYSTDAKHILEAIQKIGKSAKDIKQIVLTHAHRAHLGGLARLKELSGAPVCAHEWEADIIAGNRRQQCTTLWPMNPLILWPLQITSRILPPAKFCPVDRLLQDGDQVGPLKVIYTPGHTPGHLAFHWPQQRALLAGDTLASWPEFDQGWPCFILNFKQNWESLRRMAQMDFDILGVGHGDPITSGGAERVRALLKQRGQL
jgi:glyoxylase-like metal-dependent hydrolase (beta-lactamase superfamily II)